jgi:hypothetical protein
MRQEYLGIMRFPQAQSVPVFVVVLVFKENMPPFCEHMAREQGLEAGPAVHTEGASWLSGSDITPEKSVFLPPFQSLCASCQDVPSLSGLVWVICPSIG